MAVAANVKKVYAKSTSASPVSGDYVAGINNATHPRKRNTVETSTYNADQYMRRMGMMVDVDITLEGYEEMSDTPQGLLRSAFTSGATTYVTILDDGTNGYTYPVIVTGYDAKGSSTEVAGVTITCQLNGAPIARP